MELADDTTKVSSNRNLSGFVEYSVNLTRLCQLNYIINNKLIKFLFKKFLCLDVKLTKQIMETETETF